MTRIYVLKTFRRTVAADVRTITFIVYVLLGGFQGVLAGGVQPESIRVRINGRKRVLWIRLIKSKFCVLPGGDSEFTDVSSILERQYSTQVLVVHVDYVGFREITWRKKRT